VSKVCALVILLLAGSMLAGCQALRQSFGPPPTATDARALEISVFTPTATGTATITPTFTPPPPPTLISRQPPPTHTPMKCRDNLELVLDLSLAPGEDGKFPLLPPGSGIEKGWRVRNAGACTWDSAYLLSPEASNPDWALTGGPETVSGEVEPGGTYDFWVKLTAPLVPRAYQAEWALRNSRGEAVGSPLSLDFEIAVLPTETAMPKAWLIASPLELMPGEEAAISWTTNEAKAAYFYPFGQAWQEHPVEVDGSVLVKPEHTTTYELRAVMGDDTVEIRRITIEVKPYAAPKIIIFRLNPGNVIDRGQCVDILWRIKGRVNTVKVYRDGDFFVESENNEGSTWDCPSRSGFYTYTLRVFGPGGTTEADRMLEVR
jgi:Ig-like domain from next to BRCA1 gene